MVKTAEDPSGLMGSGSGRDVHGDRSGGSGNGGGRGSMRFIQLYTSPSFRNQRSKLVTPSEDWEESHRDVSKHKFSPVVSIVLMTKHFMVCIGKTAVRDLFIVT